MSNGSETDGRIDPGGKPGSNPLQDPHAVATWGVMTPQGREAPHAGPPGKGPHAVARSQQGSSSYLSAESRCRIREESTSHADQKGKEAVEPGSPLNPGLEAALEEASFAPPPGQEALEQRMEAEKVQGGGGASKNAVAPKKQASP